MALNKREILPVAKCCTRSLPRVISSYFAKKTLSKILIFLAQNINLSERKLTLYVCKDFPSFSRLMKEWVNRVNFSSFPLQFFFKFVIALLAREKQNVLTSQPCLHTFMETLLSANQTARTMLLIL